MFAQKGFLFCVAKYLVVFVLHKIFTYGASSIETRHVEKMGLLHTLLRRMANKFYVNFEYSGELKESLV